MKPSWFRNKPLDLKKLRRVLVINPFGLGDSLFFTPLLRVLKEEGVGQIDLLLGSRTREILETNPHVNQIFEWDKSETKDLSSKWKRFKKNVQLFWTLYRQRYDVSFDLSPSAQFAFSSFIFFWIPI